jgi:predicted nuclease of predicted toxin-antitoxin system
VKLLLDTCVWGGAAELLRSLGHDVVWSGDWGEDPGDEEILSRSHSKGRIPVTLDKDFGELVIVRGQRHSGILRVAGFAARQQAILIDHVLTLHGSELDAGAVVTAQPGRLRIRPPETARGAEDPSEVSDEADEEGHC